MYFKTTEAHEEFRQMIRKFAEEEVKPYAFMMDQNNEFPMEAVKKMGEMNLMVFHIRRNMAARALDVMS